MKRTCEGCRALQYNQYDTTCLLGYKRKIVGKFPMEFEIPDESCPKPKTYREYVKCSNDKTRNIEMNAITPEMYEAVCQQRDEAQAKLKKYEEVVFSLQIEHSELGSEVEATKDVAKSYIFKGFGMAISKLCYCISS